MPTKSSLEMLLEFAQKKSDIAAKRLGQKISQHQQEKEKLHLLLEYQKNYQTMFQDAAKKGINHKEWLNFITFIEKLEVATTEQRKNVAAAHSSKEIVSNEFQACQRTLKSYTTLSNRCQKIELQQKIKYEQKELDEFTSNRVFHKNSKK